LTGQISTSPLVLKESEGLMAVIKSLRKLMPIRQKFVNIEISPECQIVLPTQLKKIGEEIRASKQILSLKENWDGEGSPGYKESTWIRTVEFLANYALRIWREFELIIDTPIISQGPEGSIDIYWKTNDYDLLVNISENPESPATFYGENKGKNHIKGSFDPSDYNQGLLLYLIKQK